MMKFKAAEVQGPFVLHSLQAASRSALRTLAAARRCVGYAAGYDLSADPGHDTVWEIAPMNSDVDDLARDAVHIYTTLFAGCKLYLTAPSGDGCVNATVALQPLLQNMQLQQRWALAAVTGKPGRYSIVALVCV